MKASEYRGEKQFVSVPGESIKPARNEVRLDVVYCGICGTDIHIYQGHMDQRVKIPQIIGHELSARIGEIGSDVDDFEVGEIVTIRPLKPGQLVTSDKGYKHINQNLEVIGVDLAGGMQSSLTVPAYTLHRIPDGLSLQHGAMIEPLAVACHDVRRSGLKAGEITVVLGGGPIGLLIALVAKTKGSRVIISEINPYRLDLAARLGFDTADPMQGDLAEIIRTKTNDYMADIVFEVSGSKAAVADMTAIANKRGRIVMVAIHPKAQPVDLFRMFLSELTLLGARVYEAEDFEEAIRLAASGLIPLDDMITEIISLDQVQSIFEKIESNPDGMKYLIEIQKS